MSDRRARFFLVCALISLALIPFTPEDFDHVSVVVAVWTALLGLLSALDARGREG